MRGARRIAASRDRPRGAAACHVIAGGHRFWRHGLVRLIRERLERALNNATPRSPVAGEVGFRFPLANRHHWQRRCGWTTFRLRAGPKNMQIAARVDQAIEAGLGFLGTTQLASGEFPIFTSKRRDMVGEVQADPSVFPTALAAHALGFVPGAAALLDRAMRFLLDQRDRHGVWRHWTRDHPHFAALPPDLDDTSCASAVLMRNGVNGAADPQLLLSNRDQRGLFYTWIVPRLRWTGAAHRRIVAGQLRRVPALYAFFRSTSASPSDVDAVVNANCLFMLGPFSGHQLIVEHLLGVLRSGGETSCDKWYDNPFVVWYFFSRALSEVAPEARDIIVRRIASVAPSNVLETALAAASLLYWDRVPEQDAISALLDGQLDTGGWPRAALYHGGRARRPDGTFAEPHPDTPHWGSEALTTAFCLQVLARWRAACPAEGRCQTTERGRRPKLLFVFQGRQGFRIGMGRGLYATESVFRDAVDRCAKVIEARTGVDLAAGFHDPEAAERAQSNEFHSILTHGLLHIGLTALWTSKGIEPDGTVGLSLGEITSTVAAGALTPEDAITVVQGGAQWDERLLDRGKLLLLEADLATAVALCRESPAPLEFFAEYGPTSAVVFCLASDVSLISSFLRDRGIQHVVHRGDYAYHTPRFANCKDVLLAELAHLRPRPAQCPNYSSFGGGLAPRTSFFDANYWYWMMALPVWFNTAFEAALKDGYDVILNIGPHPSLEPYMRAAAKKAGKTLRFVDSLRDDAPEVATFSTALSTLLDLGLGPAGRPRRTTSEAEDLDLGNDEAICDPYPMLADLRAKGSVPFLRRHNYWLALAHDEVTAALSRPDIFSSDPARGLDPICSERIRIGTRARDAFWLSTSGRRKDRNSKPRSCP